MDLPGMKRSRKIKEKYLHTDKPEGHIELVHSGEDFFMRMIEMIVRAEDEIHLQTYIFVNDHAGNLVAEALKTAAGRGVQVYLLLDGYGTTLPDAFINDLISNGIHLRFFAPLFSASSVYLGRRLHHKIIVADAKAAIIGGINIADKYKGNKNTKPWLDYAVQFDGKAAEPLQTLCRNIYEQKNLIKRRRNPFYTLTDASIRHVQNDWLRNRKDISSMYLRNIRKARDEIIIVGSYFIPGRRLSRAINRRARKGVRVKLILAGVSDVPLIKRATSFLYALFLRNGVELYEWNDSVLHGKAAMIDGCWSTVGSFNLNHLSSYASIEMNVEIESEIFAKGFAGHLDGIISKCERIRAEDLRLKHGLYSKFLNWLSYRIVRLASIIITYIPYNRLFMKKRTKKLKYFMMD
jgi:cardiolipin synthase